MSQMSLVVQGMRATHRESYGQKSRMAWDQGSPGEAAQALQDALKLALERGLIKKEGSKFSANDFAVARREQIVGLAVRAPVCSAVLTTALGLCIRSASSARNLTSCSPS